VKTGIQWIQILPSGP